jgi:hypothetical protein
MASMVSANTLNAAASAPPPKLSSIFCLRSLAPPATLVGPKPIPFLHLSLNRCLNARSPFAAVWSCEDW